MQDTIIRSSDGLRKFIRLCAPSLPLHEGKRLRGELLVRLKDWSGLTCGEINKMPPFDRLKQGSLGKLYRI